MRKNQSVTATVTPRSGCGLIIDYSMPSTRRKRQRAVVYLRRGTPAVTSSEVEIMFDYLESLRSPEASAHNDNV